MKDDYLWDRTGEPDPEIEELEDVLGALRYQPQPFSLPADLQPEHRRKYFPPLAVAAAIALVILAAGLWVRIHRSQTAGQNQIVREQPSVPSDKNAPPLNSGSTAPGPTEERVSNTATKGPDKNSPGGVDVRKQTPPARRDAYAGIGNRRHEAVKTTDGLTAEQREQGLAAKEQLLLALRLASAKLNFAQRKTQGSPSGPGTPGTIRNQHKVG